MMKDHYWKILTVLLAVFFPCACEAKETVKEKPKLELLGAAEKDTARAMDDKSKQVDAKLSVLKEVQKVKKAEKELTIMIYMVGSNLESRNGAATNDLREIEDAGVDFDKVNIVVYAGGSRRWNSKIPNTRNSVLDLSNEDWIVASTDEAADMGAPETFANFINYTTEHFPAKEYGLICWNHGGGPVWGYGADELYSNDSLLLEEMKAALDTTIFNKDHKLAFIGYDACLMNSIELSQLWKDYARYLVASQELEAGDGWDYHFLNDLDGDALTISKTIVESYGSYYEENQSEFFHPEATLAALDLSKTDELSNALDELFGKLSSEYEQDGYGKLNQVIAKVKAFGLSAVSDPSDNYDLYDIYDFAKKYEDAYPDEVKKVKEAIAAFVVCESSNVERANGVSMYFPNDNKELYEAAKEVDTYQSDSQNKIFEDYNRGLNSLSATDWTLSGFYEEGDQIVLPLSEEQLAELSSAYYTILRRNSFGRFALTLCNVTIEPQDGLLKIAKDPLVIAAVSDLSESHVPWAFMEIEKGSSSSTLRTILSYLSAGADFTDFDRNADEKIQITIESRDEGILIKDVTADAQGAGLAGKSSIDVSRYKTIIDGAFGAYTPARDSEGHLKPFYEWSSSGMEYYPLDLENNFRFVQKKLSDYQEDFVVQVLCKDNSGNVHASEIYSFEKEAENISSINTPKGRLDFLIEAEGARMVAYEGEDEILELPETVNGRPLKILDSSHGSSNETVRTLIIPDSVTQIEAETFYGWSALEEVKFSAALKTINGAAFKYCRNLKEIELPASLESLGRAAFGNCDLKEVKLPAGLTYIGAIPFNENRDLRKIDVDAGNTAYQGLDGVLYTKDKKVLLQYPAGKGETYTIAEGCEEIAYGAFAASSLKHIVFPEGLRKIGNNAFFDVPQLEELSFPESLEEIGERVFGELILYSIGFEQRPFIDTVFIPEKVSYIGAKAFNGLLIRSFEVAETNENYASANGFILNKAKDAIVQGPRAINELVVVPESVTTLTEAVFADLQGGKEYFISDNTFRFAPSVFPIRTYEQNEAGEYIAKYDILIHASEGSAAEEYADLFDIAHDNILDPELRKKERVETESADGLFVYDVYQDHAALVAYAGEAAVLNVPDEVNGVPVTEIYERESSDFSDRAYDGSKIEKIVIPSSVKKLDTSVFDRFFNLKQIEIAEDNEVYQNDAEAIYSKNGRKLIYYFSEEKQIVELKDGIEEIGTYSFRNLFNVKKVVLPKSVIKIDESALAQLFGLEEVELNEGLLQLGDRCFGSNVLKDIVLPESLKTIGSYVFKLEGDQDKLFIPAELEKIGDAAFYAYEGQYRIGEEIIKIGKDLQIHYGSFSGLLFKGFTVDENNEYYTSDGNFLFDKSGQKLILAASDLPSAIEIPAGIVELGSGSFVNCHGLKDVYLPDSLLSIATTAFEAHYGEEEKYTLTLHCKAGSEAARYAQANGIPWVDDR